MSELLLNGIIKECTTILMSRQEIQFAILKIATILKEKSQPQTVSSIHLNNNNNPEKEFIKNECSKHIDHEIERIEDIITRKLKHIEKIENKIASICEEINEIDEYIEDLQDRAEIKERDILKLIKDSEERVNAIETTFNEEFIEISEKIKELSKNSLIKNSEANKVKFYELQKQSKIFEFDSKTLKKINENGNKSQFIFYEEIPFETTFTFHIKIIKSLHLNIRIGILNLNHKTEHKTLALQNTNNANEKKISITTKEKLAVNLGEIITVTINRKQSLINWKIKDEIFATQTNSLIGDKNIKFYPYVEIVNAGDTIEWSF